MSILDNVYKTFSNLDRDFSRSKKSRTDFITDKFGGDIDIGSIIILDAIREEGTPEDPEEIQKLSFIKDSFAFFQENAHRLDKLESFSIASADLMHELIGILSTSECNGTGQIPASQSDMWNSEIPALHYVASAHGCTFAPVQSCGVFSAYNENMLGLLQNTFGDGAKGVRVGDYCRLGSTGNLRVIQEAAIPRHVK